MKMDIEKAKNFGNIMAKGDLVRKDFLKTISGFKIIEKDYKTGYKYSEDLSFWWYDVNTRTVQPMKTMTKPKQPVGDYRFLVTTYHGKLSKSQLANNSLSIALILLDKGENDKK